MLTLRDALGDAFRDILRIGEALRDNNKNG